MCLVSNSTITVTQWPSVTVSATPLISGKLHSRPLFCLLQFLYEPPCFCATWTMSLSVPDSFLSLRGSYWLNSSNCLECRATLPSHFTGLWIAFGLGWLGHMGHRHKEPLWPPTQGSLWIQQALRVLHAVGLCSILSPMLSTHPGMKSIP